MILSAFRRAHHRRNIRALYGAIVAQARLPAFYKSYGVPDTVEGRFELIVLHLVLLLARLRHAGERPSGQRAWQTLGQGLFDVFCSDLDHNLREMGTGDLAVPREMRRFAEAFYGRQAAYSAALGENRAGELENALARNIFGVADIDGNVVRLARYTRASAERLKGESLDNFAAGRAVFPDPEVFAHA